MTDNKSHPVKVPSGGLINELALRIKLILKLLGDRRVSPLLKVIPLGTLVYLVIPDLVIGPLDDGAVVGLGMALFVELCPTYVVEEHMRTLRIQAGSSKASTRPVEKPEDEVIEGDFHDAVHPADKPDGKG
jgi:uncharacterized membrane protein YkvA (DUF1232 family)